MSTWSVLPAAGSPESIIFSSPSGPLTRADIEVVLQERLERGDESEAIPLGREAEPAAFFTDLMATWALGRALVLEPSGRRLRRSLGAPVGATRGGRAEGLLDLCLDPNQVLLELYTSGTTGRPECHAKTASQLLGEAQVLGPLFGLDAGSVVLSTVPLHHLYGLLFGLLAPLAAGARIVSDPAADPARFHPHRVAEAVGQYGVTHLVTIPAHIQSLLDAEAALVGVREVVSSAAALPIEWARRLEQHTGARVIDVLGSTESGGIAFRRGARDPSYHPLPGVTVRASEDGHLEVMSPYADSSEPLVTGDRVELLAGGTFLHLGRDDGVVKVGGKRFSLLDLEAAALGIPGVTDALAFARPTARSRGSEIWLAVATKTVDKSALRLELARKVEPLLMPRRLCLLPRLPRDARGKLAKATLERYLTLSGFDFLDLTLEPFRLELRLRHDSKRLVGHFPGAPVLPAVAQLLDLVVPEVERLAGAPVIAARRLKWQAPVLPGDVVVLTLQTAAASPGTYRFRLLGVGDATLASGVFETAC